MKLRNLIMSLVVILSCYSCQVLPLYADSKDVLEKISKGSFLKDEALHTGLNLVAVASGMSTGLIESGKFGGKQFNSSSNNYHIMRTAQDASYILYGYVLYAQMREENLSWQKKTGRIIESLAFRRQAFELSYRWNVCGDPFNYSEEISSNHKALTLIWLDSNWKPYDVYISGCGIYGVLIDLGITVGASALHLMTVR